MKIKFLILLATIAPRAHAVDISALSYSLDQLQKKLAELTEALQKFQPNLKDEIIKILSANLNFKNPNFAKTEIPYSEFMNFEIKIVQYIREKGDTPLTADFNYKGARAVLEYFDQKFLQPFFRAIRGKENNAQIVKQALDSLAQRVSQYVEEEITIGDVLEQLQEFIEVYQQNRNQADNESETRYRQLRNSVKELARYVMQSIIVDFNQVPPYEYRGDGVTPLSKKTANTFKEALNVYAKVAAREDLIRFHPLFVDWFGRVQAWQGKKPGLELSQTDAQQIISLKDKITKAEQTFRQGQLTTAQKNELLDDILKYHDLLEKMKQPEEFSVNLLYHEVCTNINCTPSPKIKKREEQLVEVTPWKDISTMTVDEMEKAIDAARDEWITNKKKPAWTSEKKQYIIRLIEAYQKKRSLKPAFARFYIELKA